MEFPAEEVSRLRNILAKIAFLDQLTMGQLDLFLEAIELAAFKKGETIVKEGAPGDKFYVIASGAVDVYKGSFLTKKHIRTMEAGSYFGEIALVQDTPRTATVTGRQPGNLYYITRKAFDEILLKNPSIAGMVRKRTAAWLDADRQRQK